MTTTVGELLRQTRESKQLELDEVADELNIRVHFLQAIEEDRMGSMASVAQMRGFKRLYASYLGLDPDDLLKPLQKDAEHLNQSGSLNEGEQNKPSTTPRVGSDVLDKPESQLVAQEDSDIEETIETPSVMVFREIGAELRRQREALGLSKFDIERQTKIRELYVHALENGQVDDLPSTVQGRGMLNNYAAFMNLDPESLQLRFAEGLQMRRSENLAAQEAIKKNPPIKKYSAPITGWRRYLTPDNLIVSGIFAVVFILVLWGAFQVIDTAKLKPKPAEENPSVMMLATATPMIIVTETPSSMPSIAQTEDLIGGELANTASVDLLATITAMGNKPIQILVVAYQRAYLKVMVDGMEQYNGRVAPGQAYPFSGSSKITLTTGNAAAIQVYYNQQDLGILGANGQVINMDFSKSGLATATPQFTSMPTQTSFPTLTPRPSYTPTVTPTVTTSTVTPFVP